MILLYNIHKCTLFNRVIYKYVFIYLKKYTHKHTHTNIFLFNRVNKMRVYYIIDNYINYAKKARTHTK